MKMPTLQVDMDFGDLNTGWTLDDPTLGQLDVNTLQTSVPNYAFPITPFVRGFAVQRGTQRELQRVDAGTATILLDNLDGRFIPLNTASPYYPNVLPMRRIRIQAIWNAVTYPIFVGYVEAWPADFPQGVDQTMPAQLVDGFKVLSLARVSGAFPAALSGTRINDILETVSWPAGARDIEPGLSVVPAVTLDNVSALEHMQAIEHAEGGRLFIARDGDLTFRDRGPGTTPAFGYRTWSDTGDLSYRDITLAYSDQTLINDVRLTREGGVEQVAQDATSIGKYYIRSLVESGIQLGTDAEVADMAFDLVQRFKDPVLRIEDLADNAMRHQLWDRVLNLDLQDRILVKKNPKGSSQISQDSIIEGVQHDVSSETWTTTFRVSPAAAGAKGVLDDPTYGLLDSTAYLSR